MVVFENLDLESSEADHPVASQGLPETIGRSQLIDFKCLTLDRTCFNAC